MNKGSVTVTWEQVIVSLKARRRGFHLVTDELLRAVPQLAHYRCGLAHFFIQHTSASLSLNENADPDVRLDMEAHFNRLMPENAPYYQHTCEGPDDMPAHLKVAAIGNAVSIPISEGRLQLGTWQGIYLGEHRTHGGARRVVVTLNGERYQAKD